MYYYYISGEWDDDKLVVGLAESSRFFPLFFSTAQLDISCSREILIQNFDCYHLILCSADKICQSLLLFIQSIQISKIKKILIVKFIFIYLFFFKLFVFF